jgi:hypothetical protein
MNNEFKRMQKLAGLITENKEYTFSDNNKAYGVLFVDNDDEEEIGNVDYMWDEDAYESLIKNMGYKEEDVKGIVGTMTEFFPAGEDEMGIFRRDENNPKLQPKDLTIGMYKKQVEKEFPISKLKEPKQGIGLDNLKRVGGNYLPPHIKY